ncbi:hypothetical protein CsSME_00010866 [Camellia sinensis var. sinensis]
MCPQAGAKCKMICTKSDATHDHAKQQAVMKQVFTIDATVLNKNAKQQLHFMQFKNEENYSILATSHTGNIQYLRVPGTPITTKISKEFKETLETTLGAPPTRFLEMAGHFPHGGGPPGAEGDPYIMSLPPRIQPFDPERYHPREHILPRAVFYHFTNFDDRAPVDLLLREPESHLSHQAREVSSHVT